MTADANTSFETPCEAIRVFCGFPNAQLTESAFFAQLGQTFMPGTPYMLQPLGLAAYLPAVLSNPTTSLPHEFALICYPSQAVWSQAMRQTLRGRVYNQTHGGVYAQPPSGAAFPVFVDNLPPMAADPFFLFADAIDWQLGTTHVVVGGKRDSGQSGADFRVAFRAQLGAERASLQNAGVDQVVATAHDDYAIAWFHSASSQAPVLPSSVAGLLANTTTLKHERILCADEPPALTIASSVAFNFVFLREQKFFLR